ncbi:MAG: serine/threonine protein kinase [Planctomycetes bacterium]|nr:serine/threonine protein kinase [Planctomycetota bacterium]
MSTESTDKPGKRSVRIGKYEVVRHIATGGMGAVYEAFDIESERPVALKVLAPEMAARKRMLARFQQEAKSAARLRHENIVAIYEFGEYSGTHFLAMEYVDGLDLHHYVLKKRRLDPEEARQILVQAARALDHAHQQHIVHRDIKPSNFLITERDGDVRVKLTDFGLAIQATDEEFRLTKAGTTVGTVDYMAPEQARKSRSADIRSDIYSLGCTFFHMLTGKSPFPTGSLAERLLQHQEAEPPDVREQQPTISFGLLAILRRMLAKKAEERYQTPAELLADLENPERLKEPTTKSDQLKTLAALAAAEGPGRKRTSAAPPIFGKDTETVPLPWEKNAAPAPAFKKTAPVRTKDQRRLPVWWPVAACCIALGIVGGFLWLRSDSPVEPKKEPEVIAKPKEVEKQKEPEPKVQPIERAFVGPPEQDLKRIVKLDDAERSTWIREVYGTFQAFPAAPAATPTVCVSRIPSAGQFTSVAEALAQTEGPIVIEIHDNGPLFEASLPPIAERSITLRGGPGYRPLIAWETQPLEKKENASSSMLALTEGSLILEDLDFVAKWSGSPEDEPPCFFRLLRSDFQARNCTFSAAGKHPRGIRLVHFLDPQLAVVTKAPRLRLTQCIVRGADLMPLFAECGGLDSLIERSLIVGNNQPLFSLTGGDSDVVAVRMVRSTLVAGAEILRWQFPTGSGAAPRLKGWIWDSALAHPAAATGSGDMIHLRNGAGRAISWRAVNSVYAGWTRLLQADDRSFPAGALDEFRKFSGYPSRDVCSLPPWPGQAIVAPEAQSADLFNLSDSAFNFASTLGPGAIGCSVGVLPPTPAAWSQRAYQWYSHQVPPLGDSDKPPPIPKGGGLYHGERIDVSKEDPAQVLRKRFKSARPGPRVVLHLAGSGKQLIEPMRIKGVDRVVLFFEPAKDGEEPLTLACRPGLSGGGGALIEVEDGSLELIGGRLAHQEVSPVARLLHVKGRELVLHRCQLLGPLRDSPEKGKDDVVAETAGCLIRFEPQSPAKESALLACKDCVFISAGHVLELRGTRAQTRFKNCLLVACGDALILDPSAASKPDLALWLENSTFAFRKSFLDLRWAPESVEGWRPIVIQAQENYFLDPFGEESRLIALLRLPAGALTSGKLVWRGKNNGFDSDRLQSYFVIGDARPEARQNITEWRRIWGRIGEQNSNMIAAPKDNVSIRLPAPSFECLAIPPELGLTLGADLARLGVLKKK